ncbi:MAG: glycosyltransferase [Akkermansiaceae bacterium]|jgi:glycosyltransferase involved in cell wall biosynthesis|nr:glycosyltransferase [Akkermansiaceae bacterium]MDP4645717.1 glycosyltransferase [Akkermansiaceae bacterium]MDP4721654.1 glycosyltransferase [Akkermansiaceae bacterium]MDP4778826.1 glycosyltransferase [Akkermansiaceae bacterium]MDP4846973.1 glycosyltransferase [Akkermansiaceae bacterium]
MKILQIFNRYAHLGGEEIAVEQISAELAANHDFRAITFDSQEWTEKPDIISKLRQFLHMAWNPNSIRLVRKEIEEFQPDVVLLHNIMPIGSAGLFLYLMRCDVPVVQFIHNFRPFSVNGYCWGNGRLLPQGLKKNFVPEILAGSWQNSRFKTAWFGLLIWLLHHVGFYQMVHGWIAISQFMKESFVKGGIDESKIQVISHSWNPQCSDLEAQALPNSGDEPVFLFLGRLTEEKGLRPLLDAWEIFEKSSPNGHLMIAGDGPMKEEVSKRCEALRHASYLGFQSGEDKKNLLRQCTALVVPSIWWEPSGLVVYEAYDYGKPVLAARSGGIIDHVEHGITGWLHEPGDIEILASQIQAANADSKTCRNMGANGRAFLKQRSASAWIDEFNRFVGQIVAKTFHEVAPPRDAPQSYSPPPPQLQITAYLADQNPGHDRSFGISRMTQIVLKALATGGDVKISTISSRTSQQAPKGVTPDHSCVLPWGTRRKWVRFLTDHFHPLLPRTATHPDLYYYPKGYLPLCSPLCQPSVVTIHDTIIQHGEDHYPDWRKSWEYGYWAMILKHTLRQADRILTVSENSKEQILQFMSRHRIPAKEITVTFEPCFYEDLPQPINPPKENHVIHLASCEPHKRTAHLIRWWHEAEFRMPDLPALHLIGTIPPEVDPLLMSSRTIVKRPFLEEAALQSAYQEARALILPSEIEGFGLPALEAYYLGTPVCFVKGTSVEEILSVTTNKGGFTLDDPESLFAALNEVMAISNDEVHECGLKLRETYSSKRVADRITEAFAEVATGKQQEKHTNKLSAGDPACNLESGLCDRFHAHSFTSETKIKP